jgi:hypothetical protein
VVQRAGVTFVSGRVMTAMFRSVPTQVSDSAHDLPVFPDGQMYDTPQTVRGKIVMFGEPRIRKVRRLPIAICSLRLKNATGYFKVTLWGETALQWFEQDQVVEVTNVRPDVYDNVTRLTSTSATTFRVVSDDVALSSLPVSNDDHDEMDKELHASDECDLLSGMIIAHDTVEIYKCCPNQKCRKKKVDSIADEARYHCTKCDKQYAEGEINLNTYARICVELMGDEKLLYVTLFRGEIESLIYLASMERIDFTDKKEVNTTIKLLYGTNMKFRLNATGDTIQRISTRKRPLIR